jgi:hypothetical protein
MQRSADPEIARSALLRVRNLKFYSYNTAKFNAFVDKIVDFFNAASEIPGTTSQTTTDTKSQDDDDLPNRSGLPKLHHHVKDQKKLFVRILHNKLSQGGVINSFFVRRSVYLAFFGHLSNFIESTREEESCSTTEGQTVQGGQMQRTQAEVAEDVEMIHDTQEEGEEAAMRTKDQEAAWKRIQEQEEAAETEAANAKLAQEREAAAKHNQEKEVAAAAAAAAKRFQEKEAAAAAARALQTTHWRESTIYITGQTR